MTTEREAVGPLTADLETIRRALPSVVVGPNTAELWAAFNRIAERAARAPEGEPELTEEGSLSWRRAICPSCRESASGVCTMHNRGADR